MLVLTRKMGEQIRIGEDIQLVVLGCEGGRVRLGFDAPETVAINREEVHQRIQAENAGFSPEYLKKAWQGAVQHQGTWVRYKNHRSF